MKTATITIFILILIIAFSALNCKKTVIENPFTNAKILDCRNLLIRKVELKDTSVLGDTAVEITVENTCKSCNDDFVYLGMVMLDRKTTDTLAFICETCLTCPRNGETKKYQLYTSLKSLPDINTVQINFIGLCTDMTYLPK